MMKSKLLIVLSLLFVLSFDGLALAEKMNDSDGGAAFSPDGIAATKSQRRRKRRRYKVRRRASIPAMATPNADAAPPESTAAPAPAQQAMPPPAPMQEEMPTMAAPPPSDPMDAPGRGRPAKKAGPTRIKPPTVNIKPPTE